jgi:predicted  nucleic acid-binding Zn-ribbon protein
MATNLTMKDLVTRIQDLEELVDELEKKITALSTANIRLTALSDEVATINRNHDSANKRIQSDIQQIVERISTSPTRIL